MIPKNMYVYCTTRFVGIHRWPNAPEHVKYLQDSHRHEFHVKVTVKVEHDDRDIEFISLKLQVETAIRDLINNWTGTASCEQIGQAIANRLGNIYSVEVSEDGENGAVVLYE